MRGVGRGGRARPPDRGAAQWQGAGAAWRAARGRALNKASHAK